MAQTATLNKARERRELQEDLAFLGWQIHLTFCGEIKKFTEYLNNLGFSKKDVPDKNPSEPVDAEAAIEKADSILDRFRREGATIGTF